MCGAGLSVSEGLPRLRGKRAGWQAVQCSACLQCALATQPTPLPTPLPACRAVACDVTVGNATARHDLMVAGNTVLGSGATLTPAPLWVRGNATVGQGLMAAAATFSGQVCSARVSSGAISGRTLQVESDAAGGLQAVACRGCWRAAVALAVSGGRGRGTRPGLTCCALPAARQPECSARQPGCGWHMSGRRHDRCALAPLPTLPLHAPPLEPPRHSYHGRRGGGGQQRDRRASLIGLSHGAPCNDRGQSQPTRMLHQRRPAALAAHLE